MRHKPKVFVTGDIHGPIDLLRLVDAERLVGGDDALIICGDFGGVWYGDRRDNPVLDSYARMPFTTYFIDGNHENFDALEKYPEVVKNGARCHKIRENLFHVMRGEILVLNDEKYFCFGGARSIDKEFREEGVSWWKQEEPSWAEWENAEANLDAAGWNVDYVITHCGPTLTITKLDPKFIDDPITDKLEEWNSLMDFRKWYFGHYHMDARVGTDHICLYHNIERVK